MWKGAINKMSSLTLQQRKSEVDSYIDSEIFENDKLVYSFVLNLYSNREIDECINYVKKLCALSHEKHLNCGMFHYFICADISKEQNKNFLRYRQTLFQITSKIFI